jgi:hypothetical protein
MTGVWKWLVFHVICGAIPYIFAVLIRYLEHPAKSPFRASPEILFLAVVVSASAFGEIAHEQRPRTGGKTFAQVVLGLGVMVSALLYGAYAHHEMNSPGRTGGVDCQVVAEWATVQNLEPSQVAARNQWGRVCGEWEDAQGMFFRASWKLAVGLIVAGWLAIALYHEPPRRGIY